MDNWLPLYSIAVSCGWHDKVESAFHILNQMDDEQVPSIMLLEDIKAILDERTMLKISSYDLVKGLISLEERPWCEWRKGQPMTQNSLSKLLDSFDIKSKQIRFSSYENLRGFELNQFEDAFSRYLPAPLTQSATTLQANDSKAFRSFQSDTTSEEKTASDTPKPLRGKACSTAALQSTTTGGESGNEDNQAVNKTIENSGVTV